MRVHTRYNTHIYIYTYNGVVDFEIYRRAVHKPCIPMYILYVDAALRWGENSNNITHTRKRISKYNNDVCVAKARTL